MWCFAGQQTGTDQGLSIQHLHLEKQPKHTFFLDKMLALSVVPTSHWWPRTSQTNSSSTWPAEVRANNFKNHLRNRNKNSVLPALSIVWRGPRPQQSAVSVPSTELLAAGDQLLFSKLSAALPLSKHLRKTIVRRGLQVFASPTTTNQIKVKLYTFFNFCAVLRAPLLTLGKNFPHTKHGKLPERNNRIFN